METTCIRCNGSFHCEMNAECWCAKLPRVEMPDDLRRMKDDRHTGCFCPDCLRAEIETVHKRNDAAGMANRGVDF